MKYEKDFESKLNELVTQMKVFEMIRFHYQDLSDKKIRQEKKITHLKYQLRSISKALVKHQKNKPFIHILPGSARRYNQQENQLKEDYSFLRMECKKLEELTDLVQFELDVLDEKLSKEPFKANKLERLLVSGFKLIDEIDSAPVIRAVQLQNEILQLIGLSGEFKELIDEGNRVLELITGLQKRFKNDLIKSVKVDDSIPPFKIYCADTISSIQVHALDLEKQLQSFSKEYDDVYTNEAVDETFKKSKHTYYSALSFSELLFKKLDKEDVSENTRQLINELSSVISNLNERFTTKAGKLDSTIDQKRSALRKSLLDR